MHGKLSKPHGKQELRHISVRFPKMPGSDNADTRLAFGKFIGKLRTEEMLRPGEADDLLYIVEEYLDSMGNSDDIENLFNDYSDF